MKTNGAKCLLCGDEIYSRHRHDFKTCTCGNLSVDGGLDYIRRCVKDPAKIQDLSSRWGCDNTDGACSCGAWHTPKDFEGERDENAPEHGPVPRKMPAPLGRPVYGLGIDPAMGGTGFAVIKDGVPLLTFRGVPLGTVKERSRFQDICRALRGPRFDYISYETPQNGTHASRAGVVRAAGIAMGVVLDSNPNIGADKVYKFTPSAWRKSVGVPTGATIDLKQFAIDKVSTDFHLYGISHDEAEAVLIGCAGYQVFKGLQPPFKTPRRPRKVAGGKKIPTGHRKCPRPAYKRSKGRSKKGSR